MIEDELVTVEQGPKQVLVGGLQGSHRFLKPAHALFQRFHKMVTARPDDPVDASLGKLTVLSGVCEFPVRVKCASLPWHTLEAALEAKTETVSLE